MLIISVINFVFAKAGSYTLLQFLSTIPHCGGKLTVKNGKRMLKKNSAIQFLLLVVLF